MNLVVAIDDLHPEQGWGCEGDIQVEYLSRLNKQYGVKFTQKMASKDRVESQKLQMKVSVNQCSTKLSQQKTLTEGGLNSIVVT